MASSRLLSYAGWGHTAFGRSDCVTQHVVKYLLDGSLPRAGTICPALPVEDSNIRATACSAIPRQGYRWFDRRRSSVRKDFAVA